MNTKIRPRHPSAPLVEVLDRQYHPRSIMGALGKEAAEIDIRHWETALLQPAREFLSRPGKGFRAALVEISWTLGGGRTAAPDLLSQMVEIIHAGSLVVDDIEDDSDERRGHPTLHRLHGVPLALNTGNWMYFWPLVLLRTLNLPAAQELDLGRRIHMALWRCHHGQALDLQIRVTKVAQREIAAIVEASSRLKTGSLTEVAAACGAVAAGASPEKTFAIARFGSDLGVGLQMLDDLGNLIGKREPEKQFEDLRNAKPTWIWAWAATTVDAFTYAQWVKRASDIEDGQGDMEALGRLLSDATLSAGRAAAHDHLTRSLVRLRDAVGACAAISALEDEITRLEVAYV